MVFSRFWSSCQLHFSIKIVFVNIFLQQRVSLLQKNYIFAATFLWELGIFPQIKHILWQFLGVTPVIFYFSVIYLENMNPSSLSVRAVNAIFLPFPPHPPHLPSPFIYVAHLLFHRTMAKSLFFASFLSLAYSSITLWPNLHFFLHRHFSPFSLVRLFFHPTTVKSPQSHYRSALLAYSSIIIHLSYCIPSPITITRPLLLSPIPPPPSDHHLNYRILFFLKLLDLSKICHLQEKPTQTFIFLISLLCFYFLF